MKSYTITVNGVAYEVTVEETAGVAPASSYARNAPRLPLRPLHARAPAPKALPRRRRQQDRSRRSEARSSRSKSRPARLSRRAIPLSSLKL